MSAPLSNEPGSSNEPGGCEIAIIGMAGRFPGAADVDAYWHNLRAGIEAVTAFTDAQLRSRGVPETLLADPHYVKAGVVLEGVDRFDAGLFGCTPREAEYLDPQQRVFLECAWQALEHSGYCGTGASVGVYGGAGANLYFQKHVLPASRSDASSDIADLLGLMNGNSSGSLCTRVAYKLDLQGPAVTVQTECSTSLVAIHLACQALLHHDCDMALAGGVWLNLLQDGGYRYQPGAILSPDGHCRAFDANAAGTVIGSGAGIVVLKRLSEALRDRDTIHAVIKGSAVNNDGAAKIGFTAPSVRGQAEVIRAALLIADVPADSIGYVEAHGTGTALGDPIEIAALTQVFAEGGARHGRCAIGSVKTNIGHLDAAAGVAGLIKTTLALQHATLPPSLNFESPNPQIDFAAGPFYVNTQPRPWLAAAAPRRAGVSSFGIGGTNAHVVLEEAPATVTAAVADAGLRLLRLSARSAHAVDAQARELARHLEQHPQLAMADASYTLRVGRRRFEERAVVLARDCREAVRVLSDRDASHYLRGTVLSAAPGVAFMFPEQGAQHLQMSRGLFASAPLFRDTVLDCCRRLLPHLGFDLHEMLYPDAPSELDAAPARLQQTACAQPALFVIEYAMAQLWQSWGVRPDALLGHGIGEYVAACLAGVFTLEDALLLAAARGRVLQACPAGAMPGAPALAEFAAVLRSVRLAAPKIPFVSKLSGQWITDEQAAQPAYWIQQLRGPESCDEGVSTLLARADRVLLEVGPGDGLSSLARRHPLAGPQRPILATQAPPQRAELQSEHLARCVAQLWVAGIEIDADAFGETAGRRVPLPTYPFERQSYWITGASAAGAAAPPSSDSPRAFEDWFQVPSWQRSLVPPQSSRVAGCVLVMGLANSFTERLIEQLRSLGARVARAEPGTAFAPIGAHAYAVRPGERTDHEQLLRRVEADLGPLSQVCHLWSLQWNDAGASQEQQECGFFSLLALAPALAACRGSSDQRQVRLTVATNRVEDVSGLDVLRPAKSTLHGPCKVIPLEYPNLQCRLLDVIAPPPHSTAEARLAAQLIDQMYFDNAASVTAIRGQHAWAKGHQPMTLAAQGSTRLRKSGVYLITGGLGGMGLSMAAHLVENWQARVVLLARSALPPRTEWPRLIAASDTDAALRRQLATLHELGAEVLVLQADVTDATAVTTALRTVHERCGALHGVIHAAGIAGGGMIAHRSRAAVNQVFAPKIRGTQVLMQALADQSLDFVLLCSSLSAITGDFGQVDYCAANSVLDAMAVQAGQVGTWPVLSVNWDTWREVGMAAQHRDAASLGHPSDRGLSSGMTPRQGALALERVLSGPALSQVIIATSDLSESLARKPEQLAARFLPAPAAKRQLHPRPALQTAYAEPREGLEQGIAALWSEFLGITPVGADDNLFELGGDSLLALQLLAKVRSAYQVEVQPAELFDSPTVAALAELVELRLIDEIEGNLAFDTTPQQRVPAES